MTIEELYSLSKWYDLNVNSQSRLYSAYQALNAKLYQNIQGQQRVPFEDERKELYSVLESISLDSLNIAQVQMLRKLNVLDFIQKETSGNYKTFFMENAIDVSAVYNYFVSVITSIDTANHKMNQIRNSISEFVDVVPSSECDEQILRVHFTHESSIDNIVQLRDWSDIWFEIGRGISMAVDDAPESFKLKSTENGSLILVLSVGLSSICLLGKVMGIVLDRVKQVYEIKKTILEVKKLQLDIKQMEFTNAVENLETAKNSLLSDSTEEIFNILKSEGLKCSGEKATALKKAIKNLIDFTNKGGELDFSVPEDDSSDDEPQDKKVIQFKESVRLIKEREREIRLLSHQFDE